MTSSKKEFLREQRRSSKRKCPGSQVLELFGQPGQLDLMFTGLVLGGGGQFFNYTEVTTIDRTGAVSFNASRDGEGGVEVGVVLNNRDQMDVFRDLLNNRFFLMFDAKLTTTTTKENEKEAVFLPMDVISSILSRVPASSLYENCRLASKAWEEMLRCPKFVNSQISCYHLNLPYRTASIVSSSDGVVLILNRIDSEPADFEYYMGVPIDPKPIFQHYIANPVTRQVLKLPDPDDSCLPREFSGIARIPNTGELKVVVVNKSRR
ncbi:hypothetical protein Tsubulata_003970 [Turnera subulata]|uniref:F-box domain-containing protein n=1 Tax=Turnera subulata TaxID=218843 RepID=A0A9Q0GFB2_9ROSI|nr:hypothetical protein Tsubulata_003970 [Turnera subulata]